MFGLFVQVTECPDCEGEGTKVDEPCGKCRGEGRTRKKRTLKVRIPAGVAPGNYIPLHDEGNYARGGQGDVLVEVEQKDHPLFLRRGDDIIVEVPVSYSQAALGAKLVVPSLGGKKKVDLPSGFQSGRVLRLKGAGIKHLNGGRGDELVRVVVHVPGKTSRDETKLLRQLDEVKKEKVPEPRKPS